MSGVPNWTEEQKSAIYAREHSVLVSAAAGSGKTAVLVERVLSLIDEGINVDRLLIVTFTRAAAAEMSERIRGAIESRREDPRMRKQALRLNRAHITTLHGYCRDLIREFFQLADVDPLAKVGDESRMNALLSRALDEAMENTCALECEENDALTREFSDAQIMSSARALYTFLESRVNPGLFCERTLRLALGDNVLSRRWLDELRKECALRLEGALELYSRCLRLLEKPGAPARYLTAVTMDGELLRALREECEKGTLCAGATAFPRLPGGKKPPDEDERLTEAFKSLREEMKKLAQSARDLIPADMNAAVADVSHTLPSLKALVRLVFDAHERYQGYKAKRNELDYGDLERLALRVLKNPEARAQAASRFDALFVDEYQDTSSLQEAILSCLHGKDTSLFMVGDVKQSIYRFRQAEPTLFLRKYASFSDAPGMENRRVLLSRNFRSRGNILRAVNLVFSRAMRENATEIAYDARAALTPGLLSRDDPPVSLTLIRMENDGDEEGELAKGYLYEAQAAADIILSLRGKAYTDASGKEKTYRYRDMAILLRGASGRAPHIARILSNAGIPVYSDADAQYYELPEVSDALNILRVLDNPFQDMPLICALSAPCFAFTAEELSRVRLHKRESGVSFAEAFYAVAETDAPLGKKARETIKRLDDWRFLSRHLTPEELLYRLVEESGLIMRAGALPRGETRQANLRLLCERARDKESLSQFLSEIEEARLSGESKSAKTLSDSEDVVRVMTVHKSKGLEFPVVIVMELARTFRMRANDDQLNCDPYLGLCLKYVDADRRVTRETFARSAFQVKRERETRAEESRLLYVAMTRAKERLYLLASPAKYQASLSRWSLPEGDYAAGSAKSMLDWIGQSLYSVLQTGADGSYEMPGGSVWSLRVRGASEFAQYLPEEIAASIPALPQTVGEETRNRLSWSLPRLSPPLKTSVTAIEKTRLRTEEDEDETPERKRRSPDKPPARRPKFMEEALPDAASRGTATHKALCALPFDSDAPIRELLDAMLSRGLLTRAERESAREDWLSGFRESELFARVRKSGKVRREWAFNLMDGSRMVQGVIDLCFLEDGQWVLIDYKTDDLLPSELPGRYAGQLNWYRRALADITGIPVKEAALYSVRYRALAPVPATMV